DQAAAKAARAGQRGAKRSGKSGPRNQTIKRRPLGRFFIVLIVAGLDANRLFEQRAKGPKLTRRRDSARAVNPARKPKQKSAFLPTFTGFGGFPSAFAA